MQRDIELIIEKLKGEIPEVQVKQLPVAHPGLDDNGVWFVSVPHEAGEVQIESPEGSCPFLIESDFGPARLQAYTVEEVVTAVLQLFPKTSRSGCNP